MTLEDDAIYLRSLQDSDFDNFFSWYSDKQITKYIGMKSLTRKSALKIFQQTLNSENGVFFGIVQKDRNMLIGYVFLTRILKNHRLAREFGIILGKDFWGKGYGSRATKLMLRYGFKHLNLHRIELIVLASNMRARYMYQKVGFIEEGVMRKARLIDRRWHDIVFMAILENEYSK